MRCPYCLQPLDTGFNCHNCQKSFGYDFDTKVLREQQELKDKILEEYEKGLKEIEEIMDKIKTKTMTAEEAQKLADDIQKIWDTPVYELSFEQAEEKVRKLIQRRFDSYAEQVARERAIEFATEIFSAYTTDNMNILKREFSKKYDEWLNNKES